MVHSFAWTDYWLVCPGFYRRAGSHGTAGGTRGAGSRPGADVCRPRPDRHQSGAAWAEGGAAACRAGDTLVVTKLDRLARSLPDARDIVDELTTRQVKLSLGGSVHDPTDPVGRLLFNVLAMVAEFEADLIRMRTREGMRVAKAKGKLRGRQPKLSTRQETHLVKLYQEGAHTTRELAEMFGVARSTVYRAVGRERRKVI